MNNWSELQRDLLSAIARRLEAVVDRVRFSGVCRNWSFVAKSEINYLPPNPPWLMLPEKPDSDGRDFVGAGGTERLTVELPKNRERWCLGSSGCWLVMIDAAWDLYFLNPFSRMEIDLPSMHDLILNEDEFCVKKVFFSFPKSQSPIEEFFAVALIMKCKLAYTKKGAKSWQSMEYMDTNRHLVDVIFYQDKIYAVDDRGKISEFNVHDEKPNTVPISRLLFNTYCRERYLVECQGLLLQLINFNSYDPWDSGDNDGFYVFKLNFTSGKWVKLKNIGQHSIFLDHCNCVSLLATSSSTFQPNHIYFSTEEDVAIWVGKKFTYIGDVCAFNLTDSVTVPYNGGPYAVCNSGSDFDTVDTRLIWIIPTSSSHSQ